MADRIQIKRGLKANLPVLADGEFGYCTDTKELFIGSTSGNIQLYPENNSGGSISVTDSVTNGYIVVDGQQIQVFDPTSINNSLAGKVDKVSGKQLSTEDYSTADKTKLSGVSTGATKTQSSGTNGHITIDGVDTTVYNDSAIQSTLSNKVDNVKYVVKDAWTTSGTRTLSGNMQKFYIHNTGNANLTFTINGIQITVKSTEEFEDVFDPFSSVIVNATSTFDAVVSALKAGSPNPEYSTKDYFADTINVTRNYSGSCYGLVVSNDGTSALTYTVNGITLTVEGGEVSERYFDAFTQATITSTVPFRAYAKSTYNVAISGSTAGVADTTPPSISISPNGGTFNTSQTVTITASDASTPVTIYYTLDGSTPTQSSSVYSAPLTISSTTTLKVIAKDSAGNINASPTTATFTIDTVAPNNVTNLTTSSVTATSLTLSWTASTSSDIASYDVYNGATLLGNVTGTTYNVTGLSEKTQYTFTVKAKDTANNVASGTSVTVTTADVTAPTNVTNLTTASITQTSLTLNWTASVSTDVASYDVYNGATLLGNTTSTTYNATGLSSGTNYTFTVKAKDASNNIASGTSVSTTTVPSDVTNLTTASVGTTSLTLNWTASTGATSYDVYNGATLLGNTTSATYNVTGLTASTQYTFKVVAKNSSGSSTGVTTTVTTASASDTTPPNDVTNLAAGTATINSIPISWTLSSSNDVANYEVAYSSNGGSSWTVASSVVNSSSTTYTITGLSAGTTYTIRVVAIDTSSNRSTGVTTTKATAASVTYTLSATPSAGTYNATQNVTLSTSPTGATIYYTTDGTTPTTSSSAYSTPIAVSSTTTIKFFAKDSVGNQSGVSTATYTIDTVAPTVSVAPTAGTYGSTQSVTLTGSDNSGTTPTIYYTTDGSTPTTGSTVYSGAITVSATTTIKYLAVDSAGNQTTGSVTYTINIDTTPPNAVTGLTAGTVTMSSINVSWTPSTSTDTANYEVAYSQDGTNYTVSGTVLVGVNSYTVTGLPTTGTQYTIRVIAIDGANNRSTATTVTATTAASGTTDTTAPVVKVYPTNTTFASDKSVTVTIMPDETATVYYTLDGTTPTTSSAVYSSPLSITSTKTLKYFAKDTAGNNSAVATSTYTKQTFATPNTTSVTSGLLHSYDLSNQSSTSTTISDSGSGTAMPLSLTSYKTDGTEGLIANSGLRSETSGYSINSTKANVGVPANSSFTVVLMTSLNTGSYGTNFFSSSNTNNAIGNYNAGAGETSASTVGRFQLITTSVGALRVHPKVLYQDTTSTQISIVRSDATTAASSINNEQAYVWTMTYDQPSKTVSLYLNGTLSASGTVTNDAKFDGFVLNSGHHTDYALLVYNRVLSSTEITQVSNDLLA
jgi:hypothetical protein